MQDLHVLHIAAAQEVAGAENHLMMLLPGLVRAGLRVTLVNVERKRRGGVSPDIAARLEGIERAGVEVHRIRARSRSGIEAVPAIARTVRRLAPDLVHTHMVYADLWGALAARLGGARRVLASKHFDYGASTAEQRRHLAYYAVANRLHDAQIAISGRVGELLRRVEGWDGRNVFVVPYGCEDQRVLSKAATQERIRADLGVPEGHCLIGTVARLIPLKALDVALDALARLRRHGLPVVWVLVGDGPEQPTLRAQADRLGIADAVRFVGFRTDIPDLMAAFDVLVHPSTAEGFGLVLLEAMIQETAVVATDVGALPEIVRDGETGWLVPPRDATALAAAVHRAVQDDALRASVAAAGRHRFERDFTVDVMTQRTIAVYRALRSA